MTNKSLLTALNFKEIRPAFNETIVYSTLTATKKLLNLIKYDTALVHDCEAFALVFCRNRSRLSVM